MARGRCGERLGHTVHPENPTPTVLGCASGDSFCCAGISGWNRVIRSCHSSAGLATPCESGSERCGLNRGLSTTNQCATLWVMECCCAWYLNHHSVCSTHFKPLFDTIKKENYGPINTAPHLASFQATRLLRLTKSAVAMASDGAARTSQSEKCRWPAFAIDLSTGVAEWLDLSRFRFGALIQGI